MKKLVIGLSCAVHIILLSSCAREKPQDPVVFYNGNYGLRSQLMEDPEYAETRGPFTPEYNDVSDEIEDKYHIDTNPNYGPKCKKHDSHLFFY
ncbi:hypothetical protein [Persicirhabdus sediminis]|uniref:Lipoprotein n=1 Tax=Persicirhabdus sediminis TaxID=454144 RepID=A0A8J7MG36_9BACT|nr:hypothetical protein [Persicirhabdus sediminis]MBK1792215.1 hypothetical protein [Persicirhabdus sediminis]